MIAFAVDTEQISIIVIFYRGQDYETILHVESDDGPGNPQKYRHHICRTLGIHAETRPFEAGDGLGLGRYDFAVLE